MRNRSASSVAGKPLHGEKTHPLSPSALAVVEELRSGPMARSGMNPGVVDRLLREGCVEVVELPSPYRTHRGKLIPHLRLLEGAAPAPQPEPAPAAKPTRKRCLGSGQTIALRGLQIAMRTAPCPVCSVLRSIAPLPGRTAVFPRHNMRDAK